MPAQKQRDLTKLFNPLSIVIIGASRTPNKVGSIVLRNVQESGYTGSVFLVHPEVTELNGITCYKSVKDLPTVPDLALVSLPASASVEILPELGEKGIKNVILFAAGFKENGAEGAKLDEVLVKTAGKYDLNLLGPNCLGFLNNKNHLNATFGQSSSEIGDLRFISQSGAIAASIFDWAKAIGLGFSEFITLGNKSVIDETDILKYFADNPTPVTKSIMIPSPIGMYLESISDGKEFIKLTTELSKVNPVFVIKPGKTPAAKTAMKSHTGSMAGEDAVFETALEQAGVVRCDTLEDFFDITRAFAWGVIPQGPNIAVISNAGGPGVLTADSVVLHGLKLVEFDEKTKTKLEQILPRTSSILDPVDLMGDALAERFGHSAEIIIENAQVDALLFLLTPQLMTQIDKTAEYIAFLSNKYSKPIFCSFIGGNLVAEGEKILNKNKIPVFRFPERAIYAISTLWNYKKKQIELSQVPQLVENVTLPQDSGEVRSIIQKAVNEKYASLDNIASDAIIKSIGINTPPTKLVCSYAEAMDFVNQYGWPVVLKISSSGILHKKDLGGVITDITNETMLDDAMHKLERKTEQILQNAKTTTKVDIQIQKGVANGIEVIVGIKDDPTFGNVLMFGAGGSYVELIKDRNLLLLPVDLSDAKKLVEKSKIFNLLKGNEGHPTYALDKLYDLIVRVGKLAYVVSEASEIEINPVIVTINDVWAVDTKVVMKTSVLPAQLPAKSSGPQYKTAKTLSHSTLASKFNHYKFETAEPFNFEPGQYISVKVGETAIRAYSIATCYDDKHFDLLVDTRPGGPGSIFFENLKEGDTLLFLGPFGKFTFCPEDGAENLLFLATGSGASAVRCMIDRALQEQNFKKPMKLYFGLTFKEEIFWKDHFDELAKKYPNFSYEIALFKPDETWKGAKGFITELVKRDFPDASKCSAYLCGHRAMIADAHDILIANGCLEERIYTERFI